MTETPMMCPAPPRDYSIPLEMTSSAAGWIAKRYEKRALPAPAMQSIDAARAGTGLDVRVRNNDEALEEWTERIQCWCEAHFDKETWDRLRSALRQRAHKEQAGRYARTITLSEKAHRVLATVAQHEGCTLSQAIERHLGPAYAAILDARLDAEEGKQ
jgi:hypothetical protein